MCLAGGYAELRSCGAGSLEAQEGLASGFLKPGISRAAQDESQLGSPAQSRCAQGREMLSAEPKKYVPGVRLQQVGAGQGGGKGACLFCFVF